MMMSCLTTDIYADVKLKTEADVDAYADKITGFNFIKGIKKSFKRETIIDDNTPFLHKQINGRNAWVVEYKDFKLEPRTVPGEGKYKHNFKVYIDSNDGTILKITSKYEGYDPNLLPEPNALSAEQQLLSGTGEIYLGFPKGPPKVSLFDAMDVCVGNPVQAKEIEALYVLWKSRVIQEPRDVWIITLRGISEPSLGPPPGFSGAPSEYTRMRTVVDANTGKWILASGFPSPEKINQK